MAEALSPRFEPKEGVEDFSYTLEQLDKAREGYFSEIEAYVYDQSGDQRDIIASTTKEVYEHFAELAQLILGSDSDIVSKHKMLYTLLGGEDAKRIAKLNGLARVDICQSAGFPDVTDTDDSAFVDPDETSTEEFHVDAYNQSLASFAAGIAYDTKLFLDFIDAKDQIGNSAFSILKKKTAIDLGGKAITVATTAIALGGVVAGGIIRKVRN